MIRVAAEARAAIERHGAATYPHECCGLLLGAFGEGDVRHAAAALAIDNAREAEARHHRFLITPDDLLRGERAARAQGQEIVGFYHSHPDCPAEPSAFDLAHAWPVYSYVIVSVRAGRIDDLRSWTLHPDRSAFAAEPITRGT